jgi:methylenetetrahydrofolate--tRNA-(uracil-5-)-methyltransferase
MVKPELIIIGGGMAGSEAAWQAAERGTRVLLYEMRPAASTPAHKTDGLAELVCSNSFGAADPDHASGILKEEMRRLGSLLLRIADQVRIPAGLALAVDREEFSRRVTKEVSNHPNIQIQREEVSEISEEQPTIVATGPLTSPKLTEALKRVIRSSYLYFYDSIAPIVDAESIRHEKVFRASRYDKGGDDYINCPMTEEEYAVFYEALMKAEKVPLKSFEKIPYFEGCVPIEVMAERGRRTLLFGPMKPVGLEDPKTGRRPFAVVQLRSENAHNSCYNLVGFQTKLTYPEQKRVFRLIPGLENAEFLRYGSIHRNTFIASPLVLAKTLQVRRQPNVFLAGQIVGVEGYMESAAMGLLAGVNAHRWIRGLPSVAPPDTTAMGSLLKYITESNAGSFQPMNINLGLFPPLAERVRDRQLRHRKVGERALENLDRWIGTLNPS